MTTPAVLNSEEIQAGIRDMAGWSYADGVLRREYKFKDFVEAMTFVMKVAFQAETLDHHPDILISYSRVTLTLSTHSAGGVTGKDLELAKKLSEIATPVPQ